MKERLLQIAEYKGLSMRAFEQGCGLQRGNISNMSENGAIGSDKLSKILDANNEINTEWLLTGKGSMLKSDNNTSVSEPSERYNKTKKGNQADLSHLQDASKEELIDIIKQLIAVNNRDSLSISKMVDTADRNSITLSRLVDVLYGEVDKRGNFDLESNVG